MGGELCTDLLRQLGVASRQVCADDVWQAYCLSTLTTLYVDLSMYKGLFNSTLSFPQNNNSLSVYKIWENVLCIRFLFQNYWHHKPASAGSRVAAKGASPWAPQTPFLLTPFGRAVRELESKCIHLQIGGIMEIRYFSKNNFSGEIIFFHSLTYLRLSVSARF